MSEQETVLATVVGSVGVITLNRPDKFNCLSPRTHELLIERVRGHAATPHVRSILVNARGDHFCTGADLAAVKARRHEGADLRDYIALGHDALIALEGCGLPTVVAVQGLCLAGGLELMLACDVAIGAETARFGDQHAAFGLVPGWGGSQRLPRAVGLRRALDMFYTARRIDAATALDWGLLNQVCAPEALLETALAYCEALGARSRAGLGAMKSLAYEGAGLPLAGALAREREVAYHGLLHPDVDEGLAAFEARREPRFA